MKTLQEQIEKEITGHEIGWVFSAADLQAAGSDGHISQCLFLLK